MANILLTINNETRQVSKARAFAGVQLENLEDAFIVKFSNTFLDGDGILEYEVDGHSYFIPMTKDSANELYSIDITKALITEEGTYPFQVRIQRDEKIFKSQIFYLKIYPSINAIDTPPDMPNWQQWVIEYVAEYGGKIDTISVNGTELPISEDKNVDIPVPTKTSDLQNDGDGNNSSYATEAYVAEYGGKIDKILKNGVELPINNKTVNVPVPVKTSELQNDGNGESPFPTKAEVNTALGEVGNAIQDINNKIPLQASSENQLADKNFVNSSIATNTANYLGDYNIVTDLGLTTSATHQQVAAALATKMQLESIVPTNNDYCYVKYPDATVPTQFVQFDRYKYNGDESIWKYEFTLNNSSFTAEQWAAINSGITGTILQQILDAVSALQQAMTTKQNVLTQGDNITIQNDTISANVPLKSVSLGGTNIPISNENVDIPAVEAEVIEIEEAEEVEVVTSIGVTPSNSKIPTEKAVADAIDDATSPKADLTDIAPNYDNTSTYAVGDCVNYDGDIWKCNTAISTAEEWDSTHWTRKTVQELIDENVPDLSNYVTLTGAQTISGTKTFNSDIQFDSNKGLGVSGQKISFSSNGEIFISSNAGIRISGYIFPNGNNIYDLGNSSQKWKNLYLSGNLSDGTYSISVANIANKNDIDLIYEKTVNKVTSITSSSTDTQYPSAKAVYDYGEAIRTVAEGKCKSYTISDVTNTSFNSQAASLSGITSFVDTAGNTIQTSSLKNGDVVLVIETDVPDRWYSSSDSNFYILETAKVDLSNYATQSDLSTGLANKLDKSNPTGTGSFSLNRKANTTVGTKSTALGNNPTASGPYSFAEGDSASATENSSHAEGSNTTASHLAAHAEGYRTTASGIYSHSQGYYTTAQRKSQHVFGEYNSLDNGGSSVATRGNYVEIVGNGTSTSARSNARTLDWSGNEELAGNITVKGTKIKDGKSNYGLAIPDSTNWTADKEIATTDDVNAKYEKPSGGIPKSDLASGVQTSLGKADSAVQPSDLLNAIYPVGSIYMSVNNTSPATLFGGTWTALNSGNTIKLPTGALNVNTGSDHTLNNTSDSLRFKDTENGSSITTGALSLYNDNICNYNQYPSGSAVSRLSPANLYATMEANTISVYMWQRTS